MSQFEAAFSIQNPMNDDDAQESIHGMMDNSNQLHHPDKAGNGNEELLLAELRSNIKFLHRTIACYYQEILDGTANASPLEKENIQNIIKELEEDASDQQKILVEMEKSRNIFPNEKEKENEENKPPRSEQARLQVDLFVGDGDIDVGPETEWRIFSNDEEILNDGDDSDSNDEYHWRNDYPNEEDERAFFT